MLFSLTIKNNGPLKDFEGVINTYNNNVYTFSGIDLNQNYKNLFTNFEGKINNIKFIVNYDYTINLGNIITSTKLDNTQNFVKSLLHIFKTIPNNNLIIIDSQKQLGLSKDKYHNYYTENLDNVLLKTNEYVVNSINNKSNNNGVILIYGLNKFINKVNNTTKITELVNNIKKSEVSLSKRLRIRIHIGYFIFPIRMYNEDIL